MEYKEEYKYLTNICLNLTDACCLACRYCFVAQKPNFMTLDTAKTAVHFLLDNLEKKKDEKASLSYFGGEPTLLWDEIVEPLTIYIRENNYPINLSITTNGVLLNEDRIKFLKDNNVNILLSIDGDKETQDYNRPFHNEDKSSFDEVSKNIPYILKYFPNTTFRATIYAPTAHLTYQNYLFAVKQGFKNIFFAPDVRHEWKQEQRDALLKETKKIFGYMYYCFTNNIELIHFSIIDKALKAIAPVPKGKTVKRCGLGTTSGSVAYDGSIFACQEQPSSGNELFKIGNIFEGGIDAKKHEAFLNEYMKVPCVTCENKNLCDNCPIDKYCNQACFCPSTDYDMFGNFEHVKEMNCLWKIWIQQECDVLWKHLHSNQNFRKYVGVNIK